jgi:hypothetical protein
MAKISDDTLLSWEELTTADEIGYLIHEAHQLRNCESRLKQAKSRLCELAQGREIRVGNNCCRVLWHDGKRTLDRELLVENGVTPKQIADSMKQGEGGWSCELPVVGGPQDGSGGGNG